MFSPNNILRHSCCLMITLALFYSTVLYAKNDLKLVVHPDEISKRLAEVASHIDKDYEDEALTLVMVMKASIVVTSDLMRTLKAPVTLEYIQSITHQSDGTRAKSITLEGIERLDLKGKNVLVIDDACSTGQTFSLIIRQLKKKQPKSLKTFATILFVKNGKRENFFQPDYYLFKLEDRYLVGYGTDHKQRYRNLPGIYELKDYD